MARYTKLVGKRIEAHYRASDVHLSAVGILVSDTGKRICLEEHFSQDGSDRSLRMEIPYEYLLRVVETASEPAPAANQHRRSQRKPCRSAALPLRSFLPEA